MLNTTNSFKNHIKLSRYINLSGLTASLIFTLLTLMLFLPLYHKSEHTTATIGTANAADTSLSLSSANSGTASVTLDVTSPTGTFASSSDSTSASFSVTSNNYTGYTLSISPSSVTQTNTLSSGSATFDELPNAVTADNFSSNSSLNNKWGYTFYKSGSSATNYYPGSTISNKIDETSSANSTANIYYIGLGVRASYTQAAGTYDNSTSDNSYILTATGNASPLVINFMRNDGTTNIFYTQTESTTATSTTLYATKPTRDHYSFINWCLGSTTTSNGVDSCNGTTYAPGATFGIDQTISNQNITLNAMWKIDTFTCAKQYRLQNADGTFPSYTVESTETVNYGGSCSYSKSVTDYKTNGGANNSQASASASGISSDQTLSLDFYRNTFTLTVNAGTNTSTPTINNVSKTTYTARWGEAVTVGVTKATNATCISYATPTWKVSSGTTGSFSSTSGTSVTYTMPKGNSAVSASSTASNVAQTITFKTSNASAITFNGTSKTNNQTMSVNCGNYTISGTYASGYEFSSWSRTGSGGFTTSSTSTSTTASSSTASTYFRVQGAATITLTGKASKLYMWNATSVQCGQTMYDNRDGTERAYTTKKIGTLCWMTTNLALGASSTVKLTSATSNVSSSGYTLPASSTSGFSSSTDQNVYNAGFQTCSSSQACYGYYTYAAATAGTNPSSGAASYDICPTNWRLPTQAEYTTLRNSYTTGAQLASNWLAVYPGGYSFSSFYNGGSYARYWSSTAISAGNAYALGFDSGSTSVGNVVKANGNSVRCVAKS